MVRKGSPVRVRQRALESRLHRAAFSLLEVVRTALKSVRGPLLGRTPGGPYRLRPLARKASIRGGPVDERPQSRQNDFGKSGLACGVGAQEGGKRTQEPGISEKRADLRGEELSDVPRRAKRVIDD